MKEVFTCWLKWAGCAAIVVVAFNCLSFKISHELKNGSNYRESFRIEHDGRILNHY